MPSWASEVLFWFFGNLLWDFVIAIGVSALIIWLKKKKEEWAAPLLYGLVSFVAIFVLAFTLVGRPLLSNRRPETTPENIEANIKAWAETLGLSIRLVSNLHEECLFAMEVTGQDSRYTIHICRPKERKQYLQFQGALTAPQGWIDSKLSKEEQAEIKHQLIMEFDRTRTVFSMTWPLKQISFSKMVPITDSLNQDTFASCLDDINMSMITAEEILAESIRLESTKQHPDISQ